jgi:hypothetical protein
MTQQRSDEAPSADAANASLEALRERLAADGCGVTATTWRAYGVVIGSRSDRKVRWFGTKVELLVLATAVPEVDNASMADFTGWAMVGGDLPGAAADVRHRPTTRGPHLVGEQCQRPSQVRPFGQGVAHLVGIADRDRVI